MQKYNDSLAIQQAEAICTIVMKERLEQTRKASKEIYNSEVFTTAIKEADIFLILRMINVDTVRVNVGELTDILRRFGTAPAYDDLAQLFFYNYLSTTLSIISDTEINIEVALSGVVKSIVTQSGDNIITQNGEYLTALTRQETQSRNDYIFAVNYLSPPDMTVTVNFV